MNSIKKYYFLDSENMSADTVLELARKNIIKDTKNSSITIIHNVNHPIPLQQYIETLNSLFKMVETDQIDTTVTDGLDIYLVTSLSILSSMVANKEFIILSSDKAFSTTLKTLRKFSDNKFKQVTQYGEVL